MRFRSTIVFILLFAVLSPRSSAGQVPSVDSITPFTRGEYLALPRAALAGCEDPNTWDDSVMRALLALDPSTLTRDADYELTLAATTASGLCDWQPAREFLAARLDRQTLTDRPYAARLAARQLGREGRETARVQAGILDQSVSEATRSQIADLYATGLDRGAREDFFVDIATDLRAPAYFVSSLLSTLIAGDGADAFVRRLIGDLPDDIAGGTGPAIVLEAIAADAALLSGTEGRLRNFFRRCASSSGLRGSSDRTSRDTYRDKLLCSRS